jgi:Xaa-Pro aminopeptidase
VFLTDFRYIEKARADLSRFDVRQTNQNGGDDVASVLRSLAARRVGFEESIQFGQYGRFRAAAKRAKLIPAGRDIAAIRAVKDDGEIECIARNQRLNEAIFRTGLRSVHEGLREEEIRQIIRAEMNGRLVEEAFDTIIASGPNSSLPHAVPGRRRIRAGEYLLFDMGVRRDHYHSDMTRTVFLGTPTTRHRHVYNIVLQAQAAALRKVRAGVACRDVDRAARDVIARAGFGEYFGHGLGHGVGLEIHEAPALNPRSDDTLAAGNVITIEPGIYIPGFGGVRIEDLIVVTRSGFVNLTSAAKRFQSISI